MTCKSPNVKLLLSLLLMAVITFGAYSDTPQNATTPLTRIMEESEGNVEFNISPDLMKIIFPPEVQKATNQGTKKAVKANVLHSGVNHLSGYRVQVFSKGYGPGVEALARARGTQVASKLRKYGGQIYVFSSAPNWYTRVGNFQTQAEANAALAEIKRALPNYASEFRVVKCQITIVK